MSFRGQIEQQEVVPVVLSIIPKTKEEKDAKCTVCGGHKSNNQRSKKKCTDSLFPDIVRPRNHTYPRNKTT